MIQTVQERRFNPVLRILAFAIVFVFTTTTVAWAGGVNVFEIKVSEKFGKVKERYKGTSDQVVIHIQDAHSSLEAQKNIAGLIGLLVDTELPQAFLKPSH